MKLRNEIMCFIGILIFDVLIFFDVQKVGVEKYENSL